ncbi:MAG: DUF4835 family protein [Spirosomataceae bacterium]
MIFSPRFLHITAFLLLFFSSISSSWAQELNCTVSVNYNQMSSKQVTDNAVLEEFKVAVANFMNNQRWTNDIFAPQEKIKCNLIINILQSPRQNVFAGNAQLQIIRPVYGSMYETVVLQYIDRNFEFSFAPEERLMVFNEQSFTNNLTSMLAYYSLIALAVDYDTFSKFGGNSLLQRAFNVVNLATDASSGWQQRGDTRNRYWLLENLQNQQLASFREALYTYHRLTLDDFASDIIGNQEKVLKLLNEMRETQQKRGNIVLFSSFFTAKAEEFVQIFSESTPETKQQAYKVLTQLAPDKTAVFRTLIK